MAANLLTQENSLLLIIDIQSKLLAAMSPEHGQAVTRYSAILAEAADLLNIPVLITEQYPKGLGATDSAIIAKLPQTAQTFSKTSFSCCQAAGFIQTLSSNQRQHIILTGMEAHICVLQTALDLQQQGYQISVVADAVCSRNSEHKFYALQRLQHQGITITNHESVLFEWLKDAAHPEFKRISALLPKG